MNLVSYRFMVRPEGVEPPTYWFVASCSIQLSYGRTLRGMQLSKDTGIQRSEQTPAESIEARKEGTPERLVRRQVEGGDCGRQNA